MQNSKMEADAARRLAVKNVARWGDTDVFPFAPENHILHDKTSEVVEALKAIDGDLDAALADQPPLVEKALALVTYEGFRWVSQIDPVWNSYFLSLVLQAAPLIEAARISEERRTVFSYRFHPDSETSALFSSAAWSEFSAVTHEVAGEFEYVAVCDIADFYGRVYHHRIDNSLRRLDGLGDVAAKIVKLLTRFSGGTSYGLPVGGPAARILSELLLNATDRMLAAHGIRFCRFADDYRLFAHSKEEAFKALLTLTEYLLRNEGLSLQRNKTRVVSTKDFLRSPLYLPEDSDELTKSERDARRLLRLSIRFDPYSPTADEDYERLKTDIEQFDIIGMLTAEVSKSRVNTPVVKRLAQVVKHLDPEVRDAAADMLVTNLDVLAPALPVVLRVLDDIFPHLTDRQQEYIPREIRRRITSEEYWIMVPVNLSYALRVLRHESSDENIELCTKLYRQVPAFIQRDIVYLMHQWQATFWIMTMKNDWNTQHPWVKRALLLASFALTDEGSHWRRSVREQLKGIDPIARDWMAGRVAEKQTELPL